MDRLEFELETKDKAEQFREALDAKLPPGLKREDWHYSSEKYGIDFFHITFQDKGRIAGTYSYERSPAGIYVCTLDLRKLPIEINIPAKAKEPETLEFFTNEINHLTMHKSEKFQERGYDLYHSTGRHYPTFSFSHQAIAKDGRFVLRYDQERDGEKYVCHLNADTTEFEKIKDLFKDWIQELFSQNSSGQKTQHRASPQPFCEQAKQI